MHDVLVVGLDVGGTSTRVLVADLAGNRRGAGRAGGANPTSHDPAAAAGQLRAALSAALAGLDAARVRQGVVGLAGVGKLVADPAARAAFDQAWAAVGLRCPYRLVGDALVAYVSATPAPSGTVLIAGTGAIAASVRATALDRVVDGHGWLLGDRGSGFWLGRAAVQATLAALEGGAPWGPLAGSIRKRLVGSSGAGSVGEPLVGSSGAAVARALVDELVQAANARPPVWLAELAPLVLAAYDTDPEARRLVSAAADHLVSTVELVHTDGLPLVLAGGLLAGGLLADASPGRPPADGLPGGLPSDASPGGTPAGPSPGVPAGRAALANAVRARIARRWPGSTPLTAGDGAAAAAWLAAQSLRHLPDPVAVPDPVALHRTLVLGHSATPPAPPPLPPHPPHPPI